MKTLLLLAEKLDEARENLTKHMKLLQADEPQKPVDEEKEFLEAYETWREKYNNKKVLMHGEDFLVVTDFFAGFEQGFRTGKGWETKY